MGGLGALLAIIFAVVTWRIYQSTKRLKRAEFIRTYVFPQGLLARLHEKHPALTLKQQQLVSRGLRKFFLCNVMAKGAFVSMPSKVVDDLWHEFILFTRYYEDFCTHAFGRFLHHTPAVVLGSQETANHGLRRCWWYACKDETINPRAPTRLPLLFALDSKLNIADGFRYSPNCNALADKKNDGRSPSTYCATDFGSGGGDGGSSDGFGDLGFSSDSSGDSSSCGGGGCGGSSD